MKRHIIAASIESQARAIADAVRVYAQLNPVMTSSIRSRSTPSGWAMAWRNFIESTAKVDPTLEG